MQLVHFFDFYDPLLEWTVQKAKIGLVPSEGDELSIITCMSLDLPHSCL